MGVFEMVVVLAVLSFGLQLAKLHYESRGNSSVNAAPTENKGGAAQFGNAPEEKQPTRKSKRRKRHRRRGMWAALLAIAGFFLFQFIATNGPQMVESTERAAKKAHRLIARPEVPTEWPLAEMQKHPNIVKGSVARQANEQIETEDPDSFIADYYPGIVQCGPPMAIKIYNEISGQLPAEADTEVDADEKGEEEKKSKRITFHLTNAGLSKDDYRAFVITFRKKMQSKIKDCNVVDLKNRSTDHLNQPKTLFSIFVSSIYQKESSAHWDGQLSLPSGQLVCEVIGASKKTEGNDPLSY